MVRPHQFSNKAAGSLPYMVLCPYVWRLSLFHCRNIPLNAVLGSTVIDVISVWCYHLFCQMGWFLPLCDYSPISAVRGSFSRPYKAQKNHFHPNSLRCYVNASSLLIATLLLDCFRSHSIHLSIVSSSAEQTVTHHLFSKVSAGFTTSLCLNTPAFHLLSRALVMGAQQQLF